MKYVKVELLDVNINGYGKGSVIEMLEETSKRLQEQGLVKLVADDTPLRINFVADNGKVPQINMFGNVIKADGDLKPLPSSKEFHYAWKITTE